MLRMEMFSRLLGGRNNFPPVSRTLEPRPISLTTFLGMSSVWRLLADVTYPIVAYTTVRLGQSHIYL
jgi:hypothetical protein